MINENHPRFASRRRAGTVSCSRQQLSHASDSQGPQAPSGAQIRHPHPSCRGSPPGFPRLTGALTLRLHPSCPGPSPGLSPSHRGSHTRTSSVLPGGPHPAFPVSLGLSHSDFIRPVWGLTGALTRALTSCLTASPAALHQTGRDEGGSTADPAGPPGRQKAQVRRLLPPTGVGRRRGWRDGRRGAAAPSSTGAPGPRRLAPTEGRARAAGRHACASGFNPPKGSTE